MTIKTAKEIYDYLDQYVIGQEEAKKTNSLYRLYAPT